MKPGGSVENERDDLPPFSDPKQSRMEQSAKTLTLPSSAVNASIVRPDSTTSTASSKLSATYKTGNDRETSIDVMAINGRATSETVESRWPLNYPVGPTSGANRTYYLSESDTDMEASSGAGAKVGNIPHLSSKKIMGLRIYNIPDRFSERDVTKLLDYSASTRGKVIMHKVRWATFLFKTPKTLEQAESVKRNLEGKMLGDKKIEVEYEMGPASNNGLRPSKTTSHSQRCASSSVSTSNPAARFDTAKGVSQYLAITSANKVSHKDNNAKFARPYGALKGYCIEIRGITNHITPSLLVNELTALGAIEVSNLEWDSHMPMDNSQRTRVALAKFGSKDAEEAAIKSLNQKGIADSDVKASRVWL